MFRRYLLKKKFWQVKRNGQNLYMKHNPRYGGLYAEVRRGETGKKGVEIIADGDKKFFDNFNELDAYLENLNHPARDPFVNILGRRSSQQFFRQIAL